MFRLPSLILFLALALGAQDPALKEQLALARQLWADQGDREGATARLLPVLAALEPQGKALSPEWQRVLVEAHGWMAVLEDRLPARRPQALKHLEAALDLDPDADLERIPFNSRLSTFLEGQRTARFARLTLKTVQDGIRLDLDGRPVRPGLRHLLPGEHRLEATLPGHRPFAQALAVSAREVRSLEITLERVSSTLRFEVAPGDATVSLDGRVLVPAGAGASREVLVDNLGSGEHLLEVSAPCHRPRRIAVPAAFSAPFADHLLEAIRLEPARGLLDLRSPMPGGRAFLGDRELGPLPLAGVAICPGTHVLRVAYPEGAWARTLEVRDGDRLDLEARPRPRLLNLGLQGAQDFAGRERLLQQLEALGERLEGLATERGREAPEDALARLRRAKGAELVLWVQPVDEQPLHHVEVVVTTLQGESVRYRVKPLEQDPLGAVAARLNRMPDLVVRRAGVILVDLPDPSGPWVLEASEGARAAGLRVGCPLQKVGGSPVGSAGEAHARMAEAKGDVVPVVQEGKAVDLPLRLEVLEVPRQDDRLCYPAVLAHLRLLRRQAKGDEAGFLAFHEALALQHFQNWDKALERLREARVSVTEGVSQGTLDYHTGLCLLRLGQVFLPEARQAFAAASRHPAATLFGPDGPLVAPLARRYLEELKP